MQHYLMSAFHSIKLAQTCNKCKHLSEIFNKDHEHLKGILECNNAGIKF